MGYVNHHIEELLSRFYPVLGKDYHKYRNHVYRVFLNCLLEDPQQEQHEKYAIAAVFHDIGIWTDATVDYLQPSIQQLEEYLMQSKKEAWTDEITLMIYWHHKVTRYQGLYWRTVQNFRKADWIDVTFALGVWGAKRKYIRQYRRAFPNSGFHRFLLRRIVRHWFAHPLHPLPMFKK